MTQQALSRRYAMVLAAAAAIAIPSFAQGSWPNRPVKFIVPAGAGTGIDATARLVADQLGRQLGQSVTVENVPGAAGIVGTEKALSAAADGYTFLYGYNQLMSINPHLYAKLPYDPVHGAVPISQIQKGGYALIASPAVPFHTFEAFVEYARAHPGQLAYASTGNGSVAHLGMELIKQWVGIDLLHVPYRSGSSVVNDLMSGRIHVRLETLSSTVPLARSGRVKALLVTTASRNPSLPEVPTLKEKLPDKSEITGWHAVWAPANVSKAVVDRMAKEIAVAMQEPKLVQQLSDLGAEVQTSTPAELTRMTERDSALWGRLVKDRGLKAD